MRTKLENKNIYDDLRENSGKKQKYPFTAIAEINLSNQRGFLAF